MGEDLTEIERKYLLKLVREDIRKAQAEKEPVYSHTENGYRKSKKKYGIKTLDKLYSIESKLKQKKDE